jgi:hypothetical protein
MSTIQVEQQKKKQLTIEDISPRWAKVITSKRKWSKTKDGLNIKDFKCCVVGEAHGFRKNYIWESDPEYCEECEGISSEFAYVRYWDETTPEFVQHWNEKHT